MDGFTWIMAAVFGAFSIALLGLSFVSRYQEWTAERLARSVALILTPEVLTMVCKRVAWRMRGTTIGGIVGMVAGFALLVNDPQLVQQPLSTMLWLGTLFAGITVGAAVTAAVSATQPQGDRLRIARAEAVDLHDYIAPIERHGARVIVALAVAVLLSSLALGASGLIHFATPLLVTGSGILTLLSTAALGLFEVDGRWLARRGQQAGSPSQLSWDDALRSGLLRSLVTAPIALGAYGLILGLSQLIGALATAGAHRDAVMIATNIGANVFGYVGLFLVIFVAVSKPQQYFRRRLWPDLAEGL